MDVEWRDAMSGDPPVLLGLFLPKAEVLKEENVEVSEAVREAWSPQPPPRRVLGEDNEMMSPATGVQAIGMQSGVAAGGVGKELGNGTVAVNSRDGSSGVGGKRAAVEEMTQDEAAERKQRRKIKRRASVAKRKERKEAYYLELESSVVQLKEENAWLSEEVANRRQERDRLLMKYMIPVVDTCRPLRILHRAHSANW